jgi:hypothetical protein
MENKKSFSEFKLVLYALALVGLIWLGLQAYWEFFKFKLWLAGFGTGVFGISGLILGFIYFHSVHKIYEQIKQIPGGISKIGSYIGFSLGLILVNPLPWSLALWLFTPPGGLNSAGEWFFIGCSIGAVIVLSLERLFAKKKS